MDGFQILERPRADQYGGLVSFKHHHPALAPLALITRDTAGYTETLATKRELMSLCCNHVATPRRQSLQMS